MKNRRGFVSNSSSASFLCDWCTKLYDVEARGGTGDDWEPPMSGLCDDCGKTHFCCPCGEVFGNEDGVDTGSQDVEVFTGEMYRFERYICPKCFTITDSCKRQFEEWKEKLPDPDFVPNEIEVKIIAAMEGVEE